MAQPDPSYQSYQTSMTGREPAEGIMDQVSELGTRAQTIGEELGAAIKERPYTTLAIAAGLAFAVGALWKLGHQRPQTRLDALRARLPDVRGHVPELPGWQSLQRWWR
jgi:hypothetical protein